MLSLTQRDLGAASRCIHCNLSRVARASASSELPRRASFRVGPESSASGDGALRTTPAARHPHRGPPAPPPALAARPAARLGPAGARSLDGGWACGARARGVGRAAHSGGPDRRPAAATGRPRPGSAKTAQKKPRFAARQASAGTRRPPVCNGRARLAPGLRGRVGASRGPLGSRSLRWGKLRLGSGCTTRLHVVRRRLTAARPQRRSGSGSGPGVPAA